MKKDIRKDVLFSLCVRVGGRRGRRPLRILSNARRHRRGRRLRRPVDNRYGGSKPPPYGDAPTFDKIRKGGYGIRPYDTHRPDSLPLEVDFPR